MIDAYLLIPRKLQSKGSTIVESFNVYPNFWEWVLVNP